MPPPVGLEQIIARIESGEFLVNDFEKYCAERDKSKRPEYMTPYTADDYRDGGFQTFLVDGISAGFCLKPNPEAGLIEIVSIFNNSGTAGLGRHLVAAAIKLGGNTLDHFDGFLSGFYESFGFEEIARAAFDDRFAPTGWDYQKLGKPDIIFRRLKQ
jgi:hypothetical protein